MGRSKAQPRPSGARHPTQELAGAGSGSPSGTAELCALCGKHVAVEEEEHITGHCSNPACGDSVFHTTCVVEHLERSLKAAKGSAFGSKAWASVQVKLRQRPHAMLASSREQKVPQRCPSCKGNGGSGHAGNGASGGMGRSRSGVGDGGAKSSSSGWGGTKQYILRPAPPSATNAWAPSSASMAATAASLAETERQEADRAARLQADAQAREEAVLALSCDALDAMRA
ncbi:hypothetical protein COHA_006491 [Chlorella ohadii]|nr:hypothetical protein COHA_006491 [Chlorella ohadii]